MLVMTAAPESVQPELGRENTAAGQSPKPVRLQVNKTAQTGLTYSAVTNMAAFQEPRRAKFGMKPE